METYVIVKKIQAKNLNDALQRESTADITEIYIDNKPSDSKIGFNLD